MRRKVLSLLLATILSTSTLVMAETVTEEHSIPLTGTLEQYTPPPVIVPTLAVTFPESITMPEVKHEDNPSVRYSYAFIPIINNGENITQLYFHGFHDATVKNVSDGEVIRRIPRCRPGTNSSPNSLYLELMISDVDEGSVTHPSTGRRVSGPNQEGKLESGAGNTSYVTLDKLQLISIGGGEKYIPTLRYSATSTPTFSEYSATMKFSCEITY